MGLLHLLAKDEGSLIWEIRHRRHSVSDLSLRLLVVCSAFEQMKQLTVREKKEEVYLWRSQADSLEMLLLQESIPASLKVVVYFGFRQNHLHLLL